MRLQIFEYRCGACGQCFEAPEIGGQAYGEFLLRSDSGELRCLNANHDRTFSEVDESTSANDDAESQQERGARSFAKTLFEVGKDIMSGDKTWLKTVGSHRLPMNPSHYLQFVDISRNSES